MNELELFRLVRNEENIAIYGAKNIAITLIKRMRYLGIIPKIAIVTKLCDNNIGLEGIKIKEIEEVENIEKYTIIIATGMQYIDEIETLLKEKNVKKILKITPEIIEEIVAKNKEVTMKSSEINSEIIDGFDKNTILQYNLNNSIKEQRLREKVKNNQKVKVLFLISEISKFTCESLYKEMLKNNIFEPIIGLMKVWEYGNEIIGQEVFEKGYNELKEKGYDISILDKITSIDEISPDIIIYSTPYLNLNNSFVDFVHLNFKYLTCYIPYGMSIVKNIGYHYNNFYINTSWINFESANYSYKLNMLNSANHGINTVSLGYPKLDSYAECKKNVLSERPIIIYAPHWSIRTAVNYSNFDKYYDFFEKLRINHPEYFFVFKPHPILINRIDEMERNNEPLNISYNEYLEYCKRWNNAENGICIEGTDYIELFKNSSCLITDCGSFIAEYLPANKPCIYLFNSEEYNQLDSYYEEGQEILSSYYLCNNENEISDIFNEVIVNGRDFKKEEREKVMKDKFINIGTSGKKICEYLENRLKC